MPLSDAWPWLTFLACVLAPLALIDLRRQVIPNALNLTLALGGLAFAHATGHLAANLLTAAFALAVLLAAQAAYAAARGRQGLGTGDIKMLAAAALWVGPFGISWLVLAAALSALAAIALRRARSGAFDPATRMPFGPHIALALVAVLVVHSQM